MNDTLDKVEENTSVLTAIEARLRDAETRRVHPIANVIEKAKPAIGKVASSVVASGALGPAGGAISEMGGIVDAVKAFLPKKDVKSRRNPTVDAINGVREAIVETESREVVRHRKLLREIDDIPGGGGGGDMLPDIRTLGGKGGFLSKMFGGLRAAGSKFLSKIPGGKALSGGLAKLGGVISKIPGVSKVAGAAGKVAGLGSRAMGAMAAPITGLFAFGEKKAELANRKDLTAEQKTVQAASTGIGAGGGALAGASGGAALGATLGSAFPVVGTAIGGVIGAIAGGIAGAWGGEKIGEKVGEAVSGTMDDAEARAAKILDEREARIMKPKKWYNPTTWFGDDEPGYKPDPSIVTGNNLGRVSEKYESGGRGVGTISTGKGDAGGVSYGTYQLASKTGTMRKFLNSKEAEPYAGRFEGLEPGTPEFNKAYKEAVKSDPEGFSEAQHAYIKRTHFDPVAAYAKAKGIDVNDPAIQEALWSQSVQHSGKGNRKIIDSAVAKGGETNEDTINALYDARGDYAGQYASASATHNRYARERQDVLAIHKKEKLAPVKEAPIALASAGRMEARATSVPEIRKEPPRQEKTEQRERRIEPVKRGDAGKTDTQIPTDYDDTLLTLMSIDRI